jgi:hypothetical protein
MTTAVVIWTLLSTFPIHPGGIYDVWIGTYDSTNTHDATLYISELGAYGN